MFNERGPNFELCPIVLTYAQHIFPGGQKILQRGSWLLVTGLNICSKSNLQKGNSNAGKYSTY